MKWWRGLGRNEMVVRIEMNRWRGYMMRNDTKMTSNEE